MLSKSASFILAVLLLLTATGLYIDDLAQTPPGLTVTEGADVQIAEYIRAGQVEVFYELDGTGREGLYHIFLAVLTTFIGNRPFGFRMVSVWISLITLALVYAINRRLYGRAAGLSAMAIMLVPLGSVLLARTITREAMLPLMTVSIMLTLTHALPISRPFSHHPNTVPFAILGLLMGLGVYLHPTHFLIVLVAMAFIAYMILTRQPMLRRTVGYLMFAIVLLIIIATPYLISTLRRPDLGGTARLSIAMTTIFEQGWLNTIGRSIAGLAVRGDANLEHNLPHRPYLDGFTAALALLGLWYAVRRFNQPRYALPLIAFVILLPVALFAPDSPNFRGYAVILPLLAMGFALGVHQLTTWFPTTRYLAFVVVLALGIHLGWTIGSLNVWSRRADVHAAYHQRTYQLAAYLDRTASNTATVVCTPHLPTIPTWAYAANQPVTLLSLMMDNPAEAHIRYVDCRTGMIFTNGGEHQQVILLEADALDGFAPYIRDWLARGDRILEGVPENSVISMIVSEPLGDTIGRFTTTAPVGYAPESPGGVAPALLPVNFDSNLTFLGYDKQSDDPYEPGSTINVITYWRVDERLPRNLSLFVHLLFDAETIVSQVDLLSVVPERLRPRDVFVQIGMIHLPNEIPVGLYETTIGAYETGGTERLAVLDNGTPRGTRLFLNEVEVIALSSTPTLPPDE